MKISLALGPRQPLSRQTAWGCLTSNLTLPGSGSLAAGYRSGYAQLLLAVGGTILTSIFAVRLIAWGLNNWERLYGNQPDTEALFESWPVLKWALLGIGAFGVGWVWALATSIEIVRSVREGQKGNVPPRLNLT